MAENNHTEANEYPPHTNPGASLVSTGANGSARLVGLIVTILVHLGAGITFGWATRATESPPFKPPTVVIEAQLAYLAKPAETKQPQKQAAPPRPSPTPTRPTPPDPQPKKQPKRKPTPEPDLDKKVQDYINQRSRALNDQSDSQTNTNNGDSAVSDAPKHGEWDGSQKGFASTSKGPKFLQELAADAHALWRVPSLERGAGVPIGCVRLGADGRIVDTKFSNPSGNANIDRSVKIALKSLKEQRNAKKQSMPPSLIAQWTSQWTCFRFRKDQE